MLTVEDLNLQSLQGRRGAQGDGGQSVRKTDHWYDWAGGLCLTSWLCYGSQVSLPSDGGRGFVDVDGMGHVASLLGLALHSLQTRILRGAQLRVRTPLSRSKSLDIETEKRSLFGSPMSEIGPLDVAPPSYL